MNDCTWCGHAPHTATCPDRIVVDAGSKGHPTTAACPCTRQELTAAASPKNRTESP